MTNRLHLITLRLTAAVFFLTYLSQNLPNTYATDIANRLSHATPEQTGLQNGSLDAIDDLVDQAISEAKLPGAVVTIGHRGSIVFQKSYGNRRSVPEPEPMQVDTVFDLASLTKPIATATSIMHLVDAGKINIDDKVADHLPEFAKEGKQDVTIKQLLLHIGGMIPDNAMADYTEGPEIIRQKFLSLKFNYDPGTKFRYSDVGFQVLGELIKAKTGKTVAEYSSEHIFQPLKMTETGYLPGKTLRKRAAPTQQRDGQWMVGDVHDPRAYAMGGIAGHAGLFGTADDLAIYAQMMLQGGAYKGSQILTPETFKAMTAAYDVPGAKRGLGWDKQSGYSSNRGESMTPSAFGHGGFTGTAIWIDPDLELFVIFLSNRVHPDGKGSVNQLAGAIGKVAADAAIAARNFKPDAAAKQSPISTATVRCGIDVLVQQNFSALAGRRVGLITNHTGVANNGTPSRILLHQSPVVNLVALLSPEHGIAGRLDQENITDTVDPDTGIKVFSLYGKDRKPSPESLQGIDTLVFDIQDIGCRFYTYISTMGEAMRVAGQHDIRFVVLDRPNPINGIDMGGPILDAGAESFVGYHTIPVRHGMTVGEIASMLNEELDLKVDLQVIQCEGWKREDFYDATGLYWINPSPNMRTLNQAILYPGVGLLEYTNLSVGRGTDTPFEIIGAPWLDAGKVAAELRSYKLPGVAIIPTRFTPESSKFVNEPCQGLQLLVTDRETLDPIRLGLAIAVALKKHHPEQWEHKNYNRLLSSQVVFDALIAGKSLDDLTQISQNHLEPFLNRRKPFLMY
jgi:uncharacterized protein YbbC (DUF1343 family)/CubicO group peptidase (beta-lactamase class C family)